jgi:hypothetical protein
MLYMHVASRTMAHARKEDAHKITGEQENIQSRQLQQPDIPVDHHTDHSRASSPPENGRLALLLSFAGYYRLSETRAINSKRLDQQV